MVNNSIYSRFTPGIISPENVTEKAYWFVFSKNKLLVKMEDGKAIIPRHSDFEEANIQIIRSQYLGTLDGDDCYSAETVENPGEGEIDGMSFSDLRSLLVMLDEDMFSIAGRAFQIVEWDRNHQYCGRCGALTETKHDERAKVCPKCGLFNYPRISPAVIVAIIKDGSILLAHNSQFRSNMYSILAGFVEPGETFEECVIREVNEEVSIKVKNIKYFGSQSWPFPHSMMVGFTAEYHSGEIKADGVEISTAGWFNARNLPTIPQNGSIARRLIDWFLSN